MITCRVYNSRGLLQLLPVLKLRYANAEAKAGIHYSEFALSGNQLDAVQVEASLCHKSTCVCVCLNRMNTRLPD